MKIAIMTLRLHANYGGILQCYALQNILRSLGHDVEVLDIRIPEEKLSNRNKIKKYIKRIYDKFLLKKNVPIFLEKVINTARVIKEKNTRQFIIKNINLSENKFIYKEDFNNADFSKYDAIVVGSDQVWRPAYSWPSLYNFFLDFINDSRIKKIAYAVSFGTDNVEYTQEQIEHCNKLIKQFISVSVRESSAVHLIKDIYKWEINNVVHVLDPTLLLDKSSYIKLLKDENGSKEKYAFSYILDSNENVELLQKNIISKINLPAKTINLEEDNLLNPSSLPHIEDWLKYIYNAEFIITDSFHGCVFSIIFNKPFIVIANRQRGYSRFSSLLSLLNLEERIMDIHEKNIENYLYHPNINWLKVNNILEQERLKSISFIKTALNGK